MRRLILVLALGVGIGYAFIPFVASDTLLKLYPCPHGIQITGPACTLNVIQPEIQLVYQSSSGYQRDVYLTAAKVCSAEIYKAFYYGIGTGQGKINKITISEAGAIPPCPQGQGVQILFVFGRRGDMLVSKALDSLDLNSSDIPGPDTTEGYLLASKTRTTTPKRLLVLCAGATEVGTARGAATLRQLIAQHCRGLVPTAMKVRDYPDCEWREVSWTGLEVGGDTITDPLKHQQLDYFSLLKCGQVEHSNHRFYFMPDSLKTPSGSDEYKIGRMINDYTVDITSNNLPNFWYPKYRHRGIEPIPLINNFENPIFHVGVWNPNCIAGTFDSLKFVVGQDMEATPIYEIPQMYNPNNPCFDDTLQHTFPNPTRGEQYNWWFNDSSTGFARWDDSIKYAGAASMMFVCDHGKWIRMVSKKILCEPDSNNHYIFSYYAKTSANFFSQKATAKIYVKSHSATVIDTSLKWERHSASIFGPQDSTKWNGVIDATLSDWRDFSLGVSTKDCDTVVFYVDFSVPNTAAPCTLWVDGDPLMNNPGNPTARYTHQQRFLAQTPAGKERVWRDGDSLTSSQYSIDYGGLSYDYGNGFLNTADPNNPNKNFQLKLNIGSPGDTVFMAYNHITGGFFYSDFKPSSRCNYASPTVDSITALYDSTGVELVRNNLHPSFIDHTYNEVDQNSLNRDGRVKIKGWTKPRVLAEDIHYNLRHTRKDDAYNNKKPTMTMLADGLLPQHQGKETWTAIDTIKSKYPLDIPYIIPKTWGFTFDKDSVLTYKKHQDSLTAEAETLADRGFALVLNPFRGKYLWWLSTLAYLKDSADFKPKGFAWTSDTAPAWTARDFRGDTVNFEYLPLSMDLAWNLDSNRFYRSDDVPDSVKVGYDAKRLHINKGDIFSPPVANFLVRAVGFDGTPEVNLIWSQNLNNDRRNTTSRYCYRIDRYDWSRKPPEDPWDTLTLNYPPTGYPHRPLDTTCVDTSPYWSEKRVPHEKYWEILHFATYRISSFDKLSNQSEYTYATARYSEFQVDSTIFSRVTAYHCQKKHPDPEGVFHLTYTGGMEDTIVYYFRFLPGETNQARPETLGIGKFPTVVVKHGLSRDTLGVAYLSQGSDTIYYTCRLDSMWLGPYSLVNSDTSNGLSVPRMALDAKDTVHLTFLERSSSDSSLILYYGRFHLTNPQGITSVSVSRWTPTASLISIDPLGAAVAVDEEGRAYFGWAENNTIKYGMSGGSGFAIKILGSTALPCTSVAMHHFNPASPGANVSLNWSDSNVIQRSYFYTGDTVEIFSDTVYSGTGPRNVTGTGSFVVFEENGGVYSSLWDAVNRTWSLPETLSTDTLPASYPQIEADQFIDSTDNLHPARFAIWTQQVDATLYTLGRDIKRYENSGEYGITPYAYLKMGKEHLTPFTLHRDGFRSFGSEDYMQIDYGNDSLVYFLPSLEPVGRYRIFAEFYFDTTAPESWKAKFRVNGVTIRDSIIMYPGEPLRITEFLPAQVIAMGYLRIKLTNERGEYVPCSRIILTRFKQE